MAAQAAKWRSALRARLRADGAAASWRPASRSRRPPKSRRTLRRRVSSPCAPTPISPTPASPSCRSTARRRPLRLISSGGSTAPHSRATSPLADPAKAHYLVRGYLSAAPTADGAEIEYVWDVFTAGKQRVQRLDDAIAVKGAGQDPWAIVGRGGADQRRGQERRRPRRLPLQHAGSGADRGGRAPAGRRRARLCAAELAERRAFAILWMSGAAAPLRRRGVILFQAAAAAMTRPILAVGPPRDGMGGALIGAPGHVRTDEDTRRQLQPAARRGDRRLSRRAAHPLPCAPLRRPRDLRRNPRERARPRRLHHPVDVVIRPTTI